MIVIPTNYDTSLGPDEDKQLICFGTGIRTATDLTKQDWEAWRRTLRRSLFSAFPEAEDKVLNSVDRAKLEHTQITEATRRIAAAIIADPVKAVASGAVINFVDDVEAATARVDGHLTDIMMAQDFHDLTGQVVAKVVSLAADLEDSLVKLLVQAAPPEQAQKVEASLLNGPVVNAEGRTDVVQNQGEVDDLLASLGF